VSNAIERVGVIGAGQMGAGIAEVSAKAGADVLVFEPTEELAAAGKARIEASLERAVSKGKLPPTSATRRWRGCATPASCPSSPTSTDHRGDRRERGRQGEGLR